MWGCELGESGLGSKSVLGCFECDDKSLGSVKQENWLPEQELICQEGQVS